MDLGNGWLGQVPQPLPALDDFAQAPAVVGHGEPARARDWLEVVARTERPAGATDDQDASVIILFEFVERTVQIRQQLPAHCVELLRPVQGDAVNLVFHLLIDDGLVRHTRPPYWG